MLSLHVFYEGHVQGVGFRWSIRNLAKGFDVTGWVRNLPDSRVQMQVNGAEDEVRSFLDAIDQSELRAHIRARTEAKPDSAVATRGFSILHD